jgi:hypothetical protein
MGIDLRQKHQILKDKEQIFRSFKVNFISPDHKSSGHLSAIKFENYNALYLEIQHYCKELFDLIWQQNYENADINEPFEKIKSIRYTDFNLDSKLTGSFKNQCIKHISGIFDSFVQGHNFALKYKPELIEKKSIKPEIDEFEIPFAWADTKINKGLNFVQINGCGEFGIKRIVGENPNSKHRPRSYGEVLRLPFKISKYHRSKFLTSDWDLASPTLCRDGIKINLSKLIPKRLNQKQNSKSKRFQEGQVGCDQGINSVITLAYRNKDGEIKSFQSPAKDKQNLTLAKIIKRMKRTKKGSKHYGRLQKLRANFIRWSINRAKNFIKSNNIQIIALEDVRFLGKGTNQGQFLNKFEHSLIRSKLNSLCEDCGASLLLQTNAYRSQRCSACGFVHKLNRKKGTKQFICLNCGNTLDADLNAALNHSVNLPPLCRGGLDNLNGEFWPEIKSGSQLGVNSVPNDPEPLNVRC